MEATRLLVRIVLCVPLVKLRMSGQVEPSGDGRESRSSSEPEESPPVEDDVLGKAIAVVLLKECKHQVMESVPQEHHDLLERLICMFEKDEDSKIKDFVGEEASTAVDIMQKARFQFTIPTRSHNLAVFGPYEGQLPSCIPSTIC